MLPQEEEIKGFTYFFSSADRILSWMDAEKLCQKWGGHLVSFRNEEEIQQFLEVKADDDSAQHWIGAIDNKGEWSWSDGTTPWS